jgi:hypothetical protein
LTKASVIPFLASSLGRRDEIPNQKLAEKVAKKNDLETVKELVENLDNVDTRIQNDCIKVLYEIGEKKPELISGFASNFLKQLDSKNNRIVWGALTALDTITSTNPVPVLAAIGKIVEIAETGSVISRDHAVSILIKLSSEKKYSDNTFPLLMKQLENCPLNQLPMYAESAAPIITSGNKKTFLKVLSSRLGEMKKESKRKRIEKVIQRLQSPKKSRT